jgi:hypothetical protein
MRHIYDPETGLCVICQQKQIAKIKENKKYKRDVFNKLDYTNTRFFNTPNLTKYRDSLFERRDSIKPRDRSESTIENNLSDSILATLNKNPRKSILKQTTSAPDKLESIDDKMPTSSLAPTLYDINNSQRRPTLTTPTTIRASRPSVPRLSIARPSVSSVSRRQSLPRQSVPRLSVSRPSQSRLSIPRLSIPRLSLPRLSLRRLSRARPSVAQIKTQSPSPPSSPSPEPEPPKEKKPEVYTVDETPPKKVLYAFARPTQTVQPLPAPEVIPLQRQQPAGIVVRNARTRKVKQKTKRQGQERKPESYSSDEEDIVAMRKLYSNVSILVQVL